MFIENRVRSLECICCKVNQTNALAALIGANRIALIFGKQTNKCYAAKRCHCHRLSNIQSNQIVEGVNDLFNNAETFTFMFIPQIMCTQTHKAHKPICTYKIECVCVFAFLSKNGQFRE